MPESISRRRFIQNAAFAGTAMALSQLSLGDVTPPVSLPKPLGTQLLPQPNTALTTSAAFSSPRTLSAVAAGTLGDVGLYANSDDSATEFAAIWSATSGGSDIHSIAWSPDEKHIAFAATSLDKNSASRLATVSVYLVNVDTRAVRELVRIGEESGSGRQLLTDVRVDGGLTWYGDNAVCMCGNDNSIVVIDCTSGAIRTLIGPQQCNRIGSITTRQDELHFTKQTRSTQGIEVNVCRAKPNRIVDDRRIPLNDMDAFASASLCPTAKYVFLYAILDGLPVIKIYDLAKSCFVKEVPGIAQDDLSYHFYAPVSMADSSALTVLDVVVLSDSGHSFFEDILKTRQVHEALSAFDISGKPRSKMARLPL